MEGAAPHGGSPGESWGKERPCPNSLRGLDLVPEVVVGWVYPGLAHPALISKCSFVNIEQRFSRDSPSQFNTSK